jgi:pyruvate dehydrogenase E2 component (dihydrolipoamide acetyltransferase)
MPQLGLTMEKGTVVEWLIGEGDQISTNQEILTVETDKSVVAVEARETGMLARVLVPAGQEVAVGAVLAIGLAPGEELPADWQPTPPVAVAPPSPEATAAPSTAQTGTDGPLEASWKARALARQAGLDLRSLTGHGPNGRIVAADVLGAADLEAAPADQATQEVASRPAIKATPVATNLAQALGLDLSQVEGSGPGGRIGQEDVLNAAASLIRRASSAAPARRPGPPQVMSITPLQGVRRIVSEGMAHSAQATARVTLLRQVDAGEFVRLRERFVAQSFDVSYNDLLIHICAVALGQHPAANARLGDDGIEHLDRIHVGLAVDTERGLLVPVVHDADRLSITRIATERQRLVTAARSGRIAPDDLSGGTFTLTNLGMFGVEGFTPIINLPECCILGVGQIVRKPVIVDNDDTIAVRPMMTLSLVFDHRVLDGAPAARFLDAIASLIEDPMLLLTNKV